MPWWITAIQTPRTALGASGTASRSEPSTSRNGKRLARRSLPICVQNLPWMIDVWRSRTDLRSTRTSGRERVIAGEQNSRLDVEPKLCESFRNAAVLLFDVRSYAHTSTLEPTGGATSKWHSLGTSTHTI